jgi:hypothetical protein
VIRVAYSRLLEELDENERAAALAMIGGIFHRATDRRLFNEALKQHSARHACFS